MKNQITFHKVKGRTIPKLRGGRGSLTHIDKNRYSRKAKHKDGISNTTKD